MQYKITKIRTDSDILLFPTVILRETLAHELEYKNFWYQLNGVLLGDSVSKFVQKRTTVEHSVVDYADRTTITPVLITGERLGLDFSKNLAYADILANAYAQGLQEFPEQFVVNYGTTFFPWNEIGRNIKVMTPPVKRGKRDCIIFMYSYNPRSIEELVLTRHKFRKNDYFLFIKMETTE
ncbi:MAG TPA: hypothetical protein PKZ56_00720 [Candidatus Paceibacterota bacterium]|nr:hypothetical protein [Candidatus Paceibacterota bacterium]